MTVGKFFESAILTEGLIELFKTCSLPETIGGAKYTRMESVLYGQVLELRRELPHVKDDLEACRVVSRVLISEDADVGEMNIYEFMPYFFHVLTWLEQAAKKEQQKLKYTPTQEEKKAGIDRLNVFGIWGTIDTISRRQGISHNEVLKLPYNDVFLMLWKDLEEANFQRRLMKAMNNK